MGIVKKQTAEKISDEELDIATAATELFFKQRPELEAQYGKAGRTASLQGVRDHLAHLSEAILASSQALFKNYVAWAQEKLAARNIPASDLAVNLNCVKEILAQRLPIENYVIAAKYMNSALLQLEKKVTRQSSYLEEDAPLSSLASQYMNLLLEGDRGAASKLILDEVDAGTSVKAIYMHVFQPVQYEIGRLWQQDKLTIAQEHYCSAATQLIMSQLYYKVVGSEKNHHKVVAACVEGDMHEIGIRMVSDFLEMEGWHTYYLGANMPKSSIIKTLHEQKPDLLLLSATMTYHLHAITELITAMHTDPDLQHIKVMVGGHPFNIAPGLWKEIGADGYANDASDALEQANRLVSEASGTA
ncbi:cobalamin-binding protein [Pontibacter diazotrophicus]|uniref:Cobalamin-binding protein n=1 Tax=Pontibacter diazotrophicus TaxID=1400979 RepID=A0A3D8LGZ2_9BACT|nr:cobalamin-dependent protein [Pontibacter diazotrophicus]RDV16504.1 cobalamin-binding protein [Pontibacter diazotrophicus]